MVPSMVRLVKSALFSMTRPVDWWFVRLAVVYSVYFRPRRTHQRNCRSVRMYGVYSHQSIYYFASRVARYATLLGVCASGVLYLFAT